MYVLLAFNCEPNKTQKPACSYELMISEYTFVDFITIVLAKW